MRARSRMLSLLSVIASSSSSSASVSSPPSLVKKLVGGSCLESPTTTSCFPRTTAPMASSGRSCEASSMMMRSKVCRPPRKYCATERGLIMKHGLSARSAPPARLTSWRMGTCARCLRSSCSRSANSVRFFTRGARTPSGTGLASTRAAMRSRSRRITSWS